MLAGALILAAALSGTAAAQDVSFRADVSAHKLGVDDTLQLTVTLEGKSINLQEELEMPELSNLRVVGGPSVSTQISMVNGAFSQAKVYTFLLQPLAVGPARIGALSARLNDGARSTQPITLEVVAGSILPQSQRRTDPFASLFADDPFDPFGRRQARPQGKILVAATPSRTSLYVGEPLLLTYYLYTQSAIAGVDFEQAPTYPGFWSEELERTEEGARGEVVEHQGERFRRFAIFRKLLYPTKAGALTLPPTTLRIGIPRGGGFFLDPLPGAASVITRSTRPLEIRVLPLPTEEGFRGAVGTLQVSADVDKRSLALGEAATARFRISGSGNLKWIEEAPDLEVPGAKVYPPQVSSEIAVTPAGLRGSKTWEFVVVPETSGDLRIPSMELAYFDPAERALLRTATAPIVLTVTGGEASSRPTVAQAMATEAAAPSGARLRSQLDLPTRALPALAVSGIVLVLALSVAGHALLWGVPRLRSLVRPGHTSAIARRSARSALADISRATRSGLSKEAAAALIEKAVVDVFGSLDESAGTTGGEREAAIREVLHEVRFIRYAPQLGDYSEKIAEVAGHARAVIRRWA